MYKQATSNNVTLELFLFPSELVVRYVLRLKVSVGITNACKATTRWNSFSSISKID